MPQRKCAWAPQLHLRVMFVMVKKLITIKKHPKNPIETLRLEKSSKTLEPNH